MQRFLSTLIPRRLKQLDRKLLIESPHIWATKVHYVAFALMIIYALATLWTAIVPLRLQNVPEPIMYFWLPLVPLLVIFLFWVYKVTHFKRAQQFGEANSRSNWQEQAMYLLVIAMFAAIPLGLNYQLNQRVGNSVSNETLAADIAHLNTAYSFFRSLKQNERCSFESKCFRYFEPYKYIGIKRRDEHENKAEFEKWIQASSQEQEAHINEYIRLLNKYNLSSVEIESSFVLDNFHNQPHRSYNDNYSDTNLRRAEQKTKDNIKRISLAKAGEKHFLRLEYALPILTIMLWSLVILMVFFKVGARIFWLAIGVSLLTTFVLRIISALVFGFLSPNTSIWFVVIFVIVVALLIRYTFKAKKDPKIVQLAMSILIGLFLISPFFALKIVELLFVFITGETVHFNDDLHLLATLAGSLLVLILWNWNLEKRLSNLDASPKSR